MRKIVMVPALLLTPLLVGTILNGEAAQVLQPPPQYTVVGNLSTLQQPVKLPPFVHSVVVYLKKDTPPAKVEALIGDCHKILAKIPSVRSLWAGRPSDKSTGNFVVKDYTVSLMLLFDNYEGLKAYEEDPTHVKFVETYLPVVEKLQVYDFMNQTK